MKKKMESFLKQFIHAYKCSLKCAFLGFGSFVSAQSLSAVEVSPSIGAWDYKYDRCEDAKSGFSDEQVAALAGAERYYNHCGDPQIVEVLPWGTLANMVYGPCGSTKLHPHTTWDFTLGVESHNGRDLRVSYCRNKLKPDGTPQYPGGIIDGMYISRTRSVVCPAGSHQSGRRCFSDYAPMKQLDDVCAGNPISYLTGNKFEKVVDYDGGKNRLKVIRTYNSLAKGWTFDFERHLVISLYNVIFAYRQNGEQYTFSSIDGVWKGDPDIFDYLVKNSQGGWSYYSQDGSVEEYDAHGSLTSIRYLDGTKLDYVYSQFGRLMEIRSSTGDVLEISYSAEGKIEEIRLPTGVIYLYQFNDDGLLRQVEQKSGEFRNILAKYIYDDPNFSYALTGVMDAEGNRYATWRYDQSGNAYFSSHGSGKEAVEINYENIANPSTPFVSVANSLGKETKYYFELLNGVRKIKEVRGEPSANCAAANKFYDYYPDGTLKSKTDWSGNVTTYERDEFGREISRTEAAGTPEARTITTEYHPTLNLPIRIAEPGRVEVMTYDEQGRLLSKNIQSTSAPSL